ncbi:MAG: hypothetical protein L6R40_006935 [Gallowayella cf. fulva]|nr:MAG: hypothetical protein L6R40_006935 [Xanthomendoza cf. fulva]
MSLDAGGLAQMTFNPHNAFGNGLGVPGSGFASRGKGSNIKRLSVAPPTRISTIDEAQPDLMPTPRTSRSHLLAGLRTAPKTATFPTSASSSQLQQHHGQNAYGNGTNNPYARGMPQTAVGGSFPRSQQIGYLRSGGNNQMYSHPEQVLAPPALQLGPQHDPEYYAELLATNHQLAQQRVLLQQQLQQQLMAAGQQLQGVDLNRQQYIQSPMTPHSSLYRQQLQSGLQPIVQAVPGRPGLYCVFNPMTGQQTLMMDNSATQQAASPPQHLLNQDLRSSPPPATPTFRAQVSPPPENSPPSNFRVESPPKLSASPPTMEVIPLPPPSSTAFRRGHTKALSFASPSAGSSSVASEGPKTGVPKSAGFPQTPMTGTFGPGQARAGDHPVRQPRGPPSLEELVAKPTSKHEGSKNFATRQRRRAVNNLVKAGMERRGASRGSGSMDSFGCMTPASEGDHAFSVSSDGDSDSVRSGSGSGSGSLSGKPSLGSLRAVASGAIGSEMKERSRERNSTGTPPTGFLSATSVSSEEGLGVGGRMVEVKVDENSRPDDERRKAPLLVLTNAEKRKSSLF